MKQITIKSALMRIMAVVLFAMGSVSASAQYYMNVVEKSGDTVRFAVSDIDSVFFSGEAESPYKYVDLGLSVKWATFNVGATKPEECGNYYAWGETETKSNFNWSTYKWLQDPLTLKKYNSIGMFGVADNKNVLDPEDDAAHVQWGGSWRMPTKAEQEELMDNCTWTWTTVNGVKGCIVTSKKAGYTDRSIFLPAGGRYAEGSCEYLGEAGCYLSNTISSVSPHHATSMYFEAAERDVNGEAAVRHYGFCVRAVCP